MSSLANRLLRLRAIALVIFVEPLRWEAVVPKLIAFPEINVEVI
jgi:hypothetical protein